MKKLLLIAVLSGMLFTNVKAQDVYNEILKTSLQVAENEKNDIETRKIATFKFDALNYMKQKVIPEVLKDTTDLKTMNKVINQLNQQSYAMYQFINYFCGQQEKGQGDCHGIVYKCFPEQSDVQ